MRLRYELDLDHHNHSGHNPAVPRYFRKRGRRLLQRVKKYRYGPFTYDASFVLMPKRTVVQPETG